ncbi:hypothetical protein [uncultured Tateyamaria sp.]|uniref:hypothetical protein n=1 Tax=uncultured Tateyamaria sp. TaxID=455651 RepID=UPI00262D246E|nr:hypothetical protein [uncultured Tateyamaria sp.]
MFPLITLGIVAGIVLLILHYKQFVRSVGSLLRDNLVDDGPTTRLLPNLAFLGLFLLLVKLTWF